MTTWSSLHKHAEVVDWHPDSKPRHVVATLKVMGITDNEMLEHIVLDLTAPVPEFLIKRAKNIVIDAAAESLRKRVMEKYAS